MGRVKPSEQVAHVGDVPSASAPREDVAAVGLGRHGTEAHVARSPDVLHNLPQVLGMAFGVPCHGLSERLGAVPGPPQRRSPVRVPRMRRLGPIEVLISDEATLAGAVS